MLDLCLRFIMIINIGTESRTIKNINNHTIHDYTFVSSTAVNLVK